MNDDPLSPAVEAHLARIRDFFDGIGTRQTRAARSYRSELARYFSLLLPADGSVLEIGCGDGELLARLPARTRTGVDLSGVQIEAARTRLPDGVFHRQAVEDLDLEGAFDSIVVSDTLNYVGDVERMFDRLLRVARPGTRLVMNFPNNLWRPLFGFATLLGLRRQQPPSSWLSRRDVDQLLRLAGWETVKVQPRLLWPVRTPLVSSFLNRWIAPLVGWAACTVFVVARPRPATEPPQRSVSVIIPARNEAGNIADAVRRVPRMGAWTEIIFVEGGSSDATWNAIEAAVAATGDRRVKALRQTGRGKGNAVREGFAAAEGDLLMILDADLTMPPEELRKFFRALVSGGVEFANGSRLVYPMEKRAMQFLNMVANHCFGLTFSWLLQQSVKDTLCGTKALSRENYLRLAANRAYFGEFDPFGDFDLLFGADKLGLKIGDVPIRYRERTYGSTNIQRWRHGLLLLRMVVFAARKLKFV